MCRPILATAFILFTVGLSVVATVDAAEPNDDGHALSISIAVPSDGTVRRIDIHDSNSHFHVIVTNRSDRTQRIFQAWNSWGYFNLRFDVVDETGDVLYAIKRNNDRNWTRNFPSWHALMPGEHFVLDVDFDRKTWVMPFLKTPDATGRFPLKLRAVFEIKPSNEATEQSVWTGEIVSEVDEFSVGYWRGPDIETNQLRSAVDPSEKYVVLGDLPVGKHAAQVLFQYPEDDGERYRVDVTISKANNTPGIDADRIDVWLLAGDGKAIKVQQRPRAGNLIETSSAGSTASATYFFQREVKRQDLVGAVVSIDGKLTVLEIPPAN